MQCFSQHSSQRKKPPKESKSNTTQLYLLIVSGASGSKGALVERRGLLRNSVQVNVLVVARLHSTEPLPLLLLTTSSYISLCESHCKCVKGKRLRYLNKDIHAHLISQVWMSFCMPALLKRWVAQCSKGILNANFFAVYVCLYGQTAGNSFAFLKCVDTQAQICHRPLKFFSLPALTLHHVHFMFCGASIPGLLMLMSSKINLSLHVCPRKLLNSGHLKVCKILKFNLRALLMTALQMPLTGRGKRRNDLRAACTYCSSEQFLTTQ